MGNGYPSKYIDSNGVLLLDFAILFNIYWELDSSVI